MITNFAVVCFYCHQSEQGHRRDNGECMAFERAAMKPYALRRRVKTPAVGWRLR